MLAVKDSESWPLVAVEAVMVLVELLKAPEAPTDGAVNVTLAPEIGLP